MRVVNMEGEAQVADFARRAIASFAASPHTYSYGDDDPTPGKLLALRWTRHSIIVVRLAEEDVLCYGVNDFSDGQLPPLTPKEGQ